MRLTCPSCHAKYTIRSERLEGRTVNVRCKRCGESFRAGPAPDLFAGIATAGAEEAEATPATTGAKALIGERNESSVLFSLATLAKQLPAPPPAAVSESSALIDLRALCAVVSSETAPASVVDDIVNLAVGGPSALPLLAPPAAFAPLSEPEIPRNRRTPVLVGATVLVVTAIAGLAMFAGTDGTAGPPTAATPAQRIADDDTATSTAPIPSAPAANIVLAATPAPSSAAIRVRPLARPSDARSSAPQIASAPVTGPKCCAGETDTACQMRLAVGASCGSASTPKEGAPPFDRPSAARALSVDVASCKRGDGPTGAGHLKVTFQPSGSVSAVDVQAPYAGTTTGACVAQRFRGVSVPAFSGGPLTVGKSFVIE